MMGKKGPPNNKGKKKTGNDLRNTGILAAAASGKTQGEIAKEFGMSRPHVNAIINSDESKAITEQARAGLVELALESVATLRDALAVRHEGSPEMRTAVNAALSVLKGLSILTEKAEEITLKPFIFERLDGSEIVMGHRPVEKGEDTNGKN